MRKRVLCAALAACMMLGVPALTSEAPRLTGVKLYVDGALAVEYSYTYENGALPTAGRMVPYMQTSQLEGTQFVQRVPPATDLAYAFDEAGRMVCAESCVEESGSTYVTRWVYDEAGRLVRLERENPEGSGLSVLSGVESYTYDGDGRLLFDASAEDGVVTYASEYAYASDGSFSTRTNYFVTELDGRRLDETGRPFHDKGAVSQTVYDYDEAGQVRRETSIVDGMLWSETAYTYEEDPLFTIQRALEHGYMNEGDAASCTFSLRDAAGKTVLSFSLPGEPELTRDSAGRLIRAETEGRCMEFSYE